ncbi:hypothetical protein B9009_013495 [Klebsiella pneumoniae]|nr:hypothetical protein B9009_013495 [Klebsiella pneumoniae]RNU43666.1 hypothetical protein B9073_014560 [Klebsiella pneumoniae]ROB75615.1 hypothetical protein C5X35_023100 [Klebsiella pneumoniae subsp. pneumoniae]ROH16724.1 hypothetical protein BL132_00011220 [Klebsiella pneumoniae]
MMSLWDALRMNMMISYQELVRTFLSKILLRASRAAHNRRTPVDFCLTTQRSLEISFIPAMLEFILLTINVTTQVNFRKITIACAS